MTGWTVRRPGRRYGPRACRPEMDPPVPSASSPARSTESTRSQVAAHPGSYLVEFGQDEDLVLSARTRSVALSDAGHPAGTHSSRIRRKGVSMVPTPIPRFVAAAVFESLRTHLHGRPWCRDRVRSEVRHLRRLHRRACRQTPGKTRFEGCRRGRGPLTAAVPGFAGCAPSAAATSPTSPTWSAATCRCTDTAGLHTDPSGSAVAGLDQRAGRAVRVSRTRSGRRLCGAGDRVPRRCGLRDTLPETGKPVFIWNLP